MKTARIRAGKMCECRCILIICWCRLSDLQWSEWSQRSHTTSESNKCFQWFGNRWLSEVPAAGIGLDVSKWLDTCLSCWFLGLVLFPRLDFWMQQAARAPSIPLDQREGTDGTRPTHSPPAAPSLLSPCTLSFSHFPCKWRGGFLQATHPLQPCFLFLDHYVVFPFLHLLPRHCKSFQDL